MDKGKGGAPGPRTRGKRRDRSSARYRPTMWDQAYSIEMWTVEPAWDLALIMAALRSRCGHYIFTMWFLSIFFYSSPNLRGRTSDVCHTSTHDVALVRI